MLRPCDRTVNELASALGLTNNAVRAHLVRLERDGFVVQSGTRPGLRKPHVLYAVAPAVEEVFPKAYGGLLVVIIDTVRKHMSAAQFRRAMRESGRTVAATIPKQLDGKTRGKRIKAAIRFLGELGGSATLERISGTDIIRGRGCPIAAATASHPEACLIAESLLREIIGAPVKERCRRGPDPSCCFKIG